MKQPLNSARSCDALTPAGPSSGLRHQCLGPSGQRPFANSTLCKHTVNATVQSLFFGFLSVMHSYTKSTTVCAYKQPHAQRFQFRRPSSALPEGKFRWVVIALRGQSVTKSSIYRTCSRKAHLLTDQGMIVLAAAVHRIDQVLYEGLDAEPPVPS